MLVPRASIRTRVLLIKSQLLCRLSYAPLKRGDAGGTPNPRLAAGQAATLPLSYSAVYWYPWKDSNLLPSRSHCDALVPLSYRGVGLAGRIRTWPANATARSLGDWSVPVSPEHGSAGSFTPSRSHPRKPGPLLNAPAFPPRPERGALAGCATASWWRRWESNPRPSLARRELCRLSYFPVCLVFPAGIEPASAA